MNKTNSVDMNDKGMKQWYEENEWKYPKSQEVGVSIISIDVDRVRKSLECILVMILRLGWRWIEKD